jgi:hypothetical protein
MVRFEEHRMGLWVPMPAFSRQKCAILDGAQASLALLRECNVGTQRPDVYAYDIGSGTSPGVNGKTEVALGGPL